MNDSSIESAPSSIESTPSSIEAAPASIEMPRKRRRRPTDLSRRYDQEHRVIAFDCCSGTRVTEEDDMEICIAQNDCPDCLRTRLQGVRLLSKTYRRRRKRRKTAFEKQTKPVTKDLRELALLDQLQVTTRPEESDLTYRGCDFFEKYLPWIRKRLGGDYREVYLGYDPTGDAFFAGAEHRHVASRSALVKFQMTDRFEFREHRKWHRDLNFYHDQGCFCNTEIAKNINIVDVRCT